MAVEIKEHARIAAVESLRWLAGDHRPVRACLFDDVVHLFAGANVVREGDATPTGAAIGDAGVLGEFVASPQHKYASVSSEEGGLLGVADYGRAKAFYEAMGWSG